MIAAILCYLQYGSFAARLPGAYTIPDRTGSSLLATLITVPETWTALR